jgi:hypothetical protein
MKIWGAIGGFGAGGWAAGLILFVSGLQMQAQDSQALVMVSASRTAAPAAAVVRVIDDPHSGEHWLLLQDESHPGGPGRLVLAAGRREGSSGGPASRTGETDRVAVLPVIHAGDRLVVEEHTAIAEARLEAVAMGPATTGSTFAVRLKIGGRVVRARAVASGRATFAPETETQP